MRLLSGILAASVGISALVLLLVDGSDENAPRTVAPTALPTELLPTTSTPSEGLPPLEWLAASDNPEATYPQHFVVDTATGELWRLGSSSAPDVSGLVLAWSPAGEALVVTEAALYVAAPTEPFRLLATDVTSLVGAWSPDGELIAVGGLILDAADGRVVAQLPRPFVSLGTTYEWSNDSRYFAASVGNAAGQEMVIWRRGSGATERIAAYSGVWANHDARFAYGPTRGSSIESRPREMRVRDFDTGGDSLLTGVAAEEARPVAWLEDDSLLAVSSRLSAIDSVHIVEVESGRTRFVVRGAEPGQWVGTSGTFVFTGHVCGAFDVFSVQADGSGLRNYTDSPAIDFYPRVSPDARHVVFETLRRDEGNIVRRLSLPSGEIANLLSGDVTVSSAIWSPDGRYLVVAATNGYDFCEAMPAQTTGVAFPSQ